MSCIQITGSPLNFAQAQPVSASIIGAVSLTPAGLATMTQTMASFTGPGTSNPCRYRYIANVGGGDVIAGVNRIPANAVWTEQAQLDPNTNTYLLLPGFVFDASGSTLFIVEYN